MTRGRSSFLFAVVASLSLCSTGCLGAFIDAGFRELDDEDEDSEYAHQSYGSHVIDSLLEDDDCDHRGACDHRCN